MGLDQTFLKCPQCQSRYDASTKKAGDAITCRCGLDFYVPKLPSLAKSWNCPNCNGSVDPSQNRCDYCDAYLAFARCPACFSIAPYDSAKYCAECGELLILPIKPILKKKPQLPCPRCESTLQSKVIDSQLVDFCNDCGGLWLEHHLFDDLLKQAPLNTTGVLGKKVPPNNHKLPHHAVRYLRCPECDATMSRHNFMRDSNVILDQCNKHGVWFDKHELAVVLDYVRSSKDRPLSKQATAKQEITQKNVISNRDENEVFEIKDEDLSLLLSEFPRWVKS